ncbi:MAG: NAD(P)-dependent oxidoreductase [Nitrospinota bacterium]|nr:NAD(P)-dependent oxidoreductase [Nitrospinota bacterium]
MATLDAGGLTGRRFTPLPQPIKSMSSATPHFLVLGANGYLGKSLADFLAPRGSLILNHRSGNGECDGDLADPATWTLFPSKCNTLFLAAGQAGHAPTLPIKTYVRNNIQVAMQLRDYLEKAEVDQLVILSTASVYRRGVSEIFEEGDLQPGDHYALSRLMADQVLHALPERTATAILRLSYPYGPGQTNRLIPLMARRISNGEEINLENEAGRPRIRPLYIDDFLEAMGKLVKEKPKGIFNLGGRETVSIKELTKAIAFCLQKENRFRTGSLPPADILVNSEKLYRALDWEPSTPLKTGLQKTLQCMELA